MTIKSLFCICLIFASTFLTGQELSVEKIWKNYEFFGASIDGFRSMKDGGYFTKTSNKKGQKTITKHEFSNYEGDGEVLVTAALLKYKGETLQMDDYFFNENESKVLITTNTMNIYRHSYSAVYYLLDLETKNIQPLDETRQPQTLAEYSPDGKKVSYIFENNLYVKDSTKNLLNLVTKTNANTLNLTKTQQKILTGSIILPAGILILIFLLFARLIIRKLTKVRILKIFGK